MSGDVARGSLCATDAVSNLIEELQFTLGEGPCVDAYHENEVVLEPDLVRPTMPRWLAFTPLAVDAGVGAVFVFPLRVGTVRLGALDLYRDGRGALSDDQHADAMVLSDVIADWVLDVQPDAPPGSVAGELERDADFHFVVHNAAGMVSVQLDVTITEALIRLRAHAFDTLVADYDVVDLLTGLAHRCVRVLGADAAGVMLASPSGNLRLVASSSEAMRVLELFELQTQEGPCLDAFRTGEVVPHETLRSGSGPWPQFSTVAAWRASGRPSRCRCGCGKHPWSAQPRPGRGDALGRSRRTGGAGVRGPRGDQRSATARRGRTPVHQRATQPRVDEPGRHRAGQGRRVRAGGHRDVRGVHATPELRPPAQPPSHRRGPSSHRRQTRTRSVGPAPST